MNRDKHERLYITQLVRKTDRTGHSAGHVVTKLVRDHIVVHGVWGKPPWRRPDYREHHREFTNFADECENDYHDLLRERYASRAVTRKKS